MNTGTDTHSRIQIEKWKDECAAQAQTGQSQEQTAATRDEWARRQAAEDADQAEYLRHWTPKPINWWKLARLTAGLFVGAYLFWLALPHVLGWLLDLNIWYR